MIGALANILVIQCHAQSNETRRDAILLMSILVVRLFCFKYMRGSFIICAGFASYPLGTSWNNPYSMRKEIQKNMPSIRFWSEYLSQFRLLLKASGSINQWYIKCMSLRFWLNHGLGQINVCLYGSYTDWWKGKYFVDNWHVSRYEALAIGPWYLC